MEPLLSQSSQKQRENIHTFLLLLPWLASFLVFWLYPLCSALYLSFTKYRTLSNSTKFVGLENYQSIFTDDAFWTAFTNTTVFTLGTIPATTTFALGLAIALNSNIRFRNFFRSAMFLPSVTSMVVIALIFTILYSHDGYINTLLKTLNLSYPKRGWLQEPSTALLSIMAMDVWIATGYYMVLFLAALQAISNSLYEAAELTGASRWQQFWWITLPMIRPTLLFVLVINTIKSFQVFVEIYVMTKGGPLDSTTTLIYLVFTNAFEKSDMMGYASALAFIVFAIILLFSLIQMKFLQPQTES